MRYANTIEHFIKFEVYKHAYLKSKTPTTMHGGVLVSGLIKKGNDLYLGL